MTPSQTAHPTEGERQAKRLENGLATLATNANPMSMGEWNDFSNAVLDVCRQLRSPQPVRPQGEEGLWRPISEAPRDGTLIDLWVYWPESGRLDRTPDAHWNDEAGEWQLGQYHAGQFVERPEIRAWMHRPPPPALSNQGKPSS